MKEFGVWLPCCNFCIKWILKKKNVYFTNLSIFEICCHVSSLRFLSISNTHFLDSISTGFIHAKSTEHCLVKAPLLVLQLSRYEFWVFTILLFVMLLSIPMILCFWFFSNSWNWFMQLNLTFKIKIQFRKEVKN